MFSLMLAPVSQGCLVTEEIEFEEELNFPASIESAPGAAHPLDEVIIVDVAAPSGGPVPSQLTLEVIVRDPNRQQELFHVQFVDSLFGGAGTIPPQAGMLTRLQEVSVDTSRLLDPGCHRIELRVSSDSSVLDGAVPEDIATAVWWVFTQDEFTTQIDPATCPQ